MQIALNEYYKDYLDESYDNLYINRYLDSICTLNTIEFQDEKGGLKSTLYFNVIPAYSEEMTAKQEDYLVKNVVNNDSKLAKLLMVFMGEKNILFERDIIFVRNADEVEGICSMNTIKNTIKELYPDDFHILRNSAV